jgi:hypothetical protein
MKLTLCLALALVPAALHAEPAPAINIAVHGAIDPSLVAASIASELARPVTPVDDCNGDCVAISVDGTRATVMFRGADGTARARTITLPSDRAQWPVLIAMLAGNLARDEADGLLVEPSPVDAPVVAPDASGPPAVVASAPVAVDAPLPAPLVVPGVAPAIAAPSVVPAPRFAPFALSLVPGASTDLLDLERSHLVSIGLVAESSSRVHGLALSGAVDVAGSVDGVQVAGAVGVTRHAVAGAQISGAVAVAGDITGVQVAGAAAVSSRSRGTQIAGAVTVAGTSAGTQIAGAVAVAESSAGTQISGGVNVARDMAGTQITGGVNVAGHASGLQIAPINIARRNDGLQFGVINIGGGPDGESFGLINIVPGGRTDVEGAIDSDGVGTVMLRHGGRHWHNVYGVGGEHIDVAAGKPNDDVWMLGLGFGPSFHLAGLPTDLEAIAWHVAHGSGLDDRLSLLAQARLTTSIPLGHIAVVVGGAVNTYVTTDASSPLTIARTTGDAMTSDVRVHVWPSAFVGVRL